MDLEKLDKLTQFVLNDLNTIALTGSSNNITYYPAAVTKINNLLTVAPKVLPEYAGFFKEASVRIAYGITVLPTKMIVEHIAELIQMEKDSEAKIKDMKIFESAEDKLRQACECFRKGDYSSAFHSLNTSLELVLKDKLGIPTTISVINTSTIIDILVSQKIEPYLYLAEAKKHVLAIDNKVKHQSYSPSKTECISGIRAMEDVISRLRNKEIVLTDEVKEKIFGEL